MSGATDPTTGMGRGEDGENEHEDEDYHHSTIPQTTPRETACGVETGINRLPDGPGTTG